MNNLRKNITFVAIVGLFFLLLYSLSKQIYDSLQAGKRLYDAQAQLQTLEDNNLKLKSEFKNVSSLNFIEEQARDRMDLAKPNETVVIISQSELDKIMAQERKVPQVKLPYWQGWLNIFGFF